ncbi:MAG TPA: hypothetical protein VE344_06945 [Methylomirabilota bacterium]|nr:hypothetical protein [Methylomirabilota bacterium]
MKSNKTLIATLAIGGLLALSPALVAADTNTPPAGAPGMKAHTGPNIDQIAKNLNLTDDQKAKVKTILDARRQKMMDLRNDTSLSREDKMAKVKTIQEDTIAQLKAIPLTQEQVDKLTKPPMRQHRPPPAGSDNNAGGGDKPAAPPQQ